MMEMTMMMRMMMRTRRRRIMTMMVAKMSNECKKDCDDLKGCKKDHMLGDDHDDGNVVDDQLSNNHLLTHYQ